MRSCGSCVHFIRIKSLNRYKYSRHKRHAGTGLCNLFDCRANCDGGRKCKKFKANKYIRERRNETFYKMAY
jgi:hypothetical protein